MLVPAELPINSYDRDSVIRGERVERETDSAVAAPRHFVQSALAPRGDCTRSESLFPGPPSSGLPQTRRRRCKPRMRWGEGRPGHAVRGWQNGPAPPIAHWRTESRGLPTGNPVNRRPELKVTVSAQTNLSRYRQADGLGTGSDR